MVAGDHRRHPDQGRARPLHEPRPGHDPAHASLPGPDVRPLHAVTGAAGGLPRDLQHVDRDRRAPRRQADPAEHTDHDRRHELRRAVAQRQAGARHGRDPDGHLDDHRRRRHARPRARGIRPARLPGAAQPLRIQPAPPADGERGRDRDRPGREARHRRRAAGRQGVADHRRGADAATGRRSALALPPSRLRRPRRPADQDRRAARGDRRPDPDLHQDRRLPRGRRRQARVQGRRRRDRHRRPRGRHRRLARLADGPHRHPDHGGAGRGGRGDPRDGPRGRRQPDHLRAASATASTPPRRWRWAPTRSRSAPPP